ncbi:hypothetical protein SDC9_203153 [bioreactor metagenome]|uniref:Uncharacterized protein n=1 Tax=bioreactor metagenome TaxID=1076179 RepID=A0A645IVV4_9ZZZZ
MPTIITLDLRGRIKSCDKQHGPKTNVELWYPQTLLVWVSTSLMCVLLSISTRPIHWKSTSKKPVELVGMRKKRMRYFFLIHTMQASSDEELQLNTPPKSLFARCMIYSEPSFSWPFILERIEPLISHLKNFVSTIGSPFYKLTMLLQSLVAPDIYNTKRSQTTLRDSFLL